MLLSTRLEGLVVSGRRRDQAFRQKHPALQGSRKVLRLGAGSL